jgi:hypothetical protein
MALTTDIRKCNNWEELVTDENYPLTEKIYFLTMVTGLGEITDTNYGEFYSRVKVYAAINGDNSITLDNIKRRIGLVTNVSNCTTSQFLKRMNELAQLDYYNATQNQIKAAYYNALVETEKELQNA